MSPWPCTSLQPLLMSRGRGEAVKKERGIDPGLTPCSKGEYTAAGYRLLQSPSIIACHSHCNALQPYVQCIDTAAYHNTISLIVRVSSYFK